MGWFNAKPGGLSPGIPPDPAVTYGWFHRRWMAVDQLVNVWVLNGLPDETISSHAGRKLRDDVSPPYWSRFVCWFCNFFQTDHCQKSIGS